jgi:hypothetical protein
MEDRLKPGHRTERTKVTIIPLIYDNSTYRIVEGRRYQAARSIHGPGRTVTLVVALVEYCPSLAESWNV